MPATVEPLENTLEPDLEIVDAHHHLGDAQGIPYFLDEFLSDTASGHNVTQSVFAEAGWGWTQDELDPARGLPEIERVAGLARESERRGGTRIGGILGFVDLRSGRRAGKVIERAIDVADGYLAGIRHVTARDSGPSAPPGLRGNSPPFLMRDPEWRAGFREVVDRGLPFDALVFHPQLEEVAELATAFPDAVIVLDHMGFPLTTGSYAGRPEQTLLEWRSAHEVLARHPGINVKIGALGTPVLRQLFHPDPTVPATSEALAEEWRPLVRWLLDLYGADRCLVGSNFPSSGVTCRYHTMLNAIKRVFSDLSPSEKQQVFAGTARRLFGLGVPNIDVVPQRREGED